MDDHAYDVVIIDDTKKSVNKDKKKFKFNADQINSLVAERIRVEHLFKKKSVDNQELWCRILKNIGLEDKCDVESARKRWDNCQQNYRKWKFPKTGVDNDSDKRALHRQTEYIQKLHEYNSDNHCFNPIKRVDTEDQSFAPFSVNNEIIIEADQIEQIDEPVASPSSGSRETSPADLHESGDEFNSTEDRGTTETDPNRSYERGLSQSQRSRKKRKAIRGAEELINLAKRHESRHEDFQEKVLERLDELGSFMKIFLTKVLKQSSSEETRRIEEDDLLAVSDYENMITDLNLK